MSETKENPLSGSTLTVTPSPNDREDINLSSPTLQCTALTRTASSFLTFATSAGSTPPIIINCQTTGDEFLHHYGYNLSMGLMIRILAATYLVLQIATYLSLRFFKKERLKTFKKWKVEELRL
jgi:hypothetical protein